MKAFAIFLVVLPVTALQTLFPPPEGPYLVTWKSSELVDHNRVDPFNSSHPRRMMISQFSPVEKDKCIKTCRVPYMPPEIAKFEDDVLTAFLNGTSWPSGILAKLEMEVCCEVAGGGDGRNTRRNRQHKFPTVLFGAGLNTTRLTYSATAQQLASMGYEIIVMDHPYETDVVQFPNGDIIYGGRVPRDLGDTPAIRFGLKARSQDASFVLDTLKVCRTVFIGQSFGGPAAADAMLNDRRIVGGVNLDGLMVGAAVQEGVPAPFMIFGSDGHNSSRDSLPSWDDFLTAMEKKRPDVWSKELNMKDTNHGSYVDSSIIGDLADLRKQEDLLVFCGKATGKHVMKVLRAYMSAFVDFALGRADEGLLAGPSEKYPDVSFLR